MITIYTASWLLQSASSQIENGALAIEGANIVAVGSRQFITEKFPTASVHEFPESAIIPGLINTHTHLELTVMRGYLENEEVDFFAWLRKLTIARKELMTPDDIRVSATWGACEAVRSGITCVGDASDSAAMSMLALKEVGLRGIVFQESFGPEPSLAYHHFEELKTKVANLREAANEVVRVGVSPHAAYTVCSSQLELIAEFSQAENLPLMMHAAESAAEDSLIRDGCGIFADGLAKRNIHWSTPGVSPIQYLRKIGVLETRPLLAHCIRVDEKDIDTLAETKSRIAHCPKSNAKFGHGRAPFARFLAERLDVGLGSDSVASNNTCDILEESRYAALTARTDARVSAEQVFSVATVGGASCLGLGGATGQLEAGAQADFAVISLNGVHQVPIYDPVVPVIFSSSGRDVVMTVVAGKEVFRDGHVVNVDEERLRARMREIAATLEPMQFK
ncbi:MAG TPA: amidohydrolase family protein [Pyrinomonadaceae bacterium]|jgi:5-methylthioadenosine/S-adenosylhomocysteine deaminase|nr:amidohydrolase family protein [Pyrinomonadaceae bacterium]